MARRCRPTRCASAAISATQGFAAAEDPIVSRVRSFSSSASSETVASDSRILAQLQWYTTDPCGGNQWQSERRSVGLSGTQWDSVPLGATQWRSMALSGACAPASLAARGTQPAATQASTRGERGAERASQELRGCGMAHAMRMNKLKRQSGGAIGPHGGRSPVELRPRERHAHAWRA